MKRLITFLLTRTYLVVVTTPDLESAFRIFSILNERGLDLTPADILKAQILGRIEEGSREQYTIKWESTEDDLGREPFDELLAHIRTDFVKARLRTTVVKEFRDLVLTKIPDSRTLIDDVILPNAVAFADIRGESYDVVDEEGSDVTLRINRLLRFLNMLDNFDWVPPAMSFLRINRQQPQLVERFLKALDRMAWSLFIRRVDVNGRAARYGVLLRAIEAGQAPKIDVALDLSAEDRRDTLKVLGGDLYNVPRIPQPVLLRLEDCVAENGLGVRPKTLSVEHVLPQTMDSGGWWEERFSNDAHDRWVHRVGNLVLLSRSKNSTASNYDFETKKDKYFKTEGVVTWALTVQVLNTPDWTETALEARQAACLVKLTDLWDLGGE